MPSKSLHPRGMYASPAGTMRSNPAGEPLYRLGTCAELISPGS